MKTLLFVFVAVALFPTAGFPCSMEFTATVVCGKFDQIATRTNGKEIAVGVISKESMTSGFFDTACEWVETTIEPSAEFTVVTELKKSAAKKVLAELKKAKTRGEEVCVFSTFYRKPDIASVSPRAGRSTKQILEASF
jgi:hypothetical protein